MDSMRSLNTSLPGGTSPSKQQPVADPPESLLSAFRAAALSVTQLYKTASSDQARARADGYQDALDELLLFLDREDIGLSDGEGWRIRRWATERLDGRESAPHAESDEENTEKPERASSISASPILNRSQTTARPQSIPRSTRTASPEQVEPVVPVRNIPTPIEEEEEPSGEPHAPQAAFTFRSQHAYPQDSDIILADLETSENTRPHQRNGSVGSHGANTRTNQTTRTNSRRLNVRGVAPAARGSGQKRKLNFTDYSDFFGIDLDKDRFGGGGAKRGRYT